MKKILLILIILIIVLVFLGFYFLFFKKTPQDHYWQIKKSGKIIIGLEPLFAPFEFYDKEGNLVGFDVDLAKEIAKELGVQPEFKVFSWDELFPALLVKKEIDVIISAVSITPERAKIMAFSVPYFMSGQIALFKEGKELKTIEDLKGKKIGVQTDTTSELEAKKITNPELVIGFQNYKVAKEALLKGEIDAILVDFAVGKKMAAENPQIKILGEPITQEFYGVVLRKDEKELLAKINQAIENLKVSGYLKLLEEKWIQKD